MSFSSAFVLSVKMMVNPVTHFSRQERFKYLFKICKLRFCVLEDSRKDR